MKWAQVTFVMVVMICVTGCWPRSSSVDIDYSRTAVPQEGGLSFVRITQDSDGVSGPRFTRISENDLALNITRGFSVADQKIVFRGYKNEKYSLYIKNLTGGRAIQQRTFSGLPDDPAFSSDGSKIVFSDRRGGGWNIYMISAETGFATRQITSDSAVEYDPVFAPGDSTILYVQRYEDQSGTTRRYLWTYDLTRDISIQYVEGQMPSFLPDGKNVITTRYNRQARRYEIWRIDLERGREFLILSDPDRDFYMAAPSPDGKTLALVASSYSEGIPINADIYLVGSDGSGLTQITYHPGMDVSPAWASNGLDLYFVSQRGSPGGDTISGGCVFGLSREIRIRAQRLQKFKLFIDGSHDLGLQTKVPR